MKRIRRSHEKRNKFMYMVLCVLMFSFVFFFSVGYAYYQQELKVGGNAKLLYQVTEEVCPVYTIESKGNITVNNNNWSPTAGQYIINATNTSNERMYYYAIIVDLPKKASGTDFQFHDDVDTEIGDTYIIRTGYNQNGWATGQGITQYWQYQFPSGTNINLEEEQYRVIFSQTAISLECDNNVWIQNGETITTNVENTKLAALSVDKYEISPEFDSRTYEYNVIVKNEDERVKIQALAQDPNSTVTITGNNDLQVGKNVVTITVTGINGGTRDYVLNVTRLKANQNYNSNYEKQGINIVNNATWSSMYNLVITNNTGYDITNWKVYFDVGTGRDYSNWNNNWSSAGYSYDADTGILALFYSSNSDQQNIKATMTEGSQVRINGNLNTDETPKIIGFSYELVGADFASVFSVMYDDEEEANEVHSGYKDNGIDIDYQNPWASQYTFNITNNSETTIKNWILKVNVGKNQNFDNWNNNWTNNTYTYDRTSGMMSFGCQNNSASCELSVGETVKINGDFNTGKTAVVEDFTYEVVK